MNLSRSLRLICLTVAAVCAVSIAAALTASAYIDRGSVRISDPGTLTLKVGESTQMTVTPAEEAHYPGCQMAECPKVCGEKDCIVMVNGQMECTCKGTEPVTYQAVVDPHSSDSSGDCSEDVSRDLSELNRYTQLRIVDYREVVS